MWQRIKNLTKSEDKSLIQDYEETVQTSLSKQRAIRTKESSTTHDPLADEFKYINRFNDRFSRQVFLNVHKELPLKSDPDTVKQGKFRRTIDSWKPQSEVYFQRYGGVVLAAGASLSGGLITSVIRRFLFLEHQGRVSMFIFNLYFPALFTGLYNVFVTAPWTVTRNDDCIPCPVIKSGMLHGFLSTAYPLIYGIPSGLYFAQAYFTYNVPHDFAVSADSRKISYKIVKEMFSKSGLKKLLLASFIINTSIAGFISYRQQHELLDVYEKILIKEDERLKIVHEANRGAAIVDAKSSS